MDKNRVLNLFPQCRLCGIFGNHRIDIFGEKLRPGPNSRTILSAKIFHCVEVRVSHSSSVSSSE